MTIEERIEKLERGLARAKRTNVGLSIILCLAVLAMISGAAVEEKKTDAAIKEIRANKIVLEDEKGNTRMILDATGDKPGLILLNKNGKTVVSLYVEGDLFTKQAGLIICDEKGTIRTDMHYGVGFSSLTLNGYDGEHQVSFTAMDEMTLFGLRSGGTGQVIRMYVGKSESEMSLVDEKKQPRVQMCIKDNGSGIYIGDKDGMNRAAIGCAQTKTSDGKTINYPESSILLFGPDGKGIWEAPR